MTADKPVTATLDNISNLLQDDIRVKVAIVDIDGALAGKIIHKDKFLQVVEDGFGFCSVVFGWDLHDTPYTTDVEFAGDECEFPDLIAKVDLSSYRRIPWEDNVPFFLAHLVNPKNYERFYACPRSLLQGAVDDYAQQLGMTAHCGVEYEFFCFQETSETAADKGYHDLKPLWLGGCGYSLLRPTQRQEFYYKAFDWLHEFKVPIESWHTETGPGVFEAAIAYTEAKEAGDRATLFKTCMKQIALKHGFMASFMAKPYADKAGCSGHIHFSLKNKDGKNAFYPWAEDQKSEIPNMSKTMVAFLAGVLRGLPSIMAILAPTVNSYKRLTRKWFAPQDVSWGIENRAGAVRVIVPPVSSPAATRLEMRVGGADINPHLAIAAVLRCGFWGITTNQTLPIPAMDLSKKDNAGEALPKSLLEAMLAMEAKGSIARQVLGDEFVEHYCKTRRHEWNLWQESVTTFELERYLELI
ncbi:hypothetical protein BCR43DRAFT_484775 [Syncephalastrum racemosum]|uniref:Glutamine synthetase n=1 Tax=Syncephalastrum racemosum TaxID=13706 RepID=A0A1X2HMQ6_SYNRA|nr:hypothetical protein BCR43DRAFT_484775 [Syncephalastrum racemosum]